MSWPPALTLTTSLERIHPVPFSFGTLQTKPAALLSTLSFLPNQTKLPLLSQAAMFLTGV